MLVPSSASEQSGNVSDGTTGETPVPPSVRRSRFRLVRRLCILFVLVGLMVGAGIVARPHLRAWYHRRAAREELQRYHTTQAIHHLLICREIWPRDPEVLLLAARAARRGQIYPDAKRLLSIYQEVRGRDDARAFEMLLLVTECRADEVAHLCWKGIEEGRLDTPLTLEALTRGYLRQYQLGQARRCLNRWKEEQPDNPQIYFLEGLLQLDYLHDMSDAVGSYRRAVELDPEHEEARLGLAIALLKVKNHAEAAEQFRYLRHRQPDNAHVQASLAECLDGLGETDEAARLVDDVLARQPQLAPALSLFGQLAIKRGQWTEAETSLRQALRADPLDHRARYSLIRCLEQNGQEEEARRQQDELSKQEEDMARFHELVTKEIGKRPTDPAVHCKIGQHLLRAGQREEGIRWLQSALHLDPHYAPARQALTDCMSQAKPTSP